MAAAPSTRLDRKAMVAFIAAFLAVGLTYIAVFIVPPLITVFVDDLGLSHSQAGTLMSVYLAGYAVISLVCGQLADRFGAVRVMGTGVVLAGAATLLFAVSDNYAVFLFSRAIVGVATGLIYAPGIAFVARLLPQRQLSTGVGVYLSGLSAGITVAFFVTPLLEDAYGWRRPFAVFGIVILVGAALFYVMARPVSAQASRPAEFLPEEGVPTRELVTAPAFLKVCAALFVAMFVAFGVLTWIPPFFDEVAGFSASQISFALGISVAVGMPATVIAGWASDRTGRPLAVAGVGFGMTVSLLVLAAVDQISFGLATLMAIVAAFGVTGGLIPLFALPAMVVKPEATAAATGIATSAAMCGAIVSTFLGGWLVGVTDGYAVPFVIYVAAAGLALVVFFPVAAVTVRSRRQSATA